MKIIFNYGFIRSDLFLFIVSTIITIFLIGLIIYLGVKEIKKDVDK